jgi:hypothetical protein
VTSLSPDTGGPEGPIPPKPPTKESSAIPEHRSEIVRMAMGEVDGLIDKTRKRKLADTQFGTEVTGRAQTITLRGESVRPTEGGTRIMETMDVVNNIRRRARTMMDESAQTWGTSESDRVEFEEQLGRLTTETDFRKAQDLAGAIEAKMRSVGIQLETSRDEQKVHRRFIGDDAEYVKQRTSSTLHTMEDELKRDMSRSDLGDLARNARSFDEFVYEAGSQMSRGDQEYLESCLANRTAFGRVLYELYDDITKPAPEQQNPGDTVPPTTT